jgi:hypothetical protein
MDFGSIQQQLERVILLCIPFFGDALIDMTPDDKRQFLLDLAEAIAAGAARGMIEGIKNDTGGKL